MIKYRVREIRVTDKHGVIESTYVPEYKRTFYGIGYWTRFPEFEHRGSYSAVQEAKTAWDYIKTKRDLGDRFQYDEELTATRRRNVCIEPEMPENE